MLVPFAACSARLSVFLVLAHAFFPKYAGLVVFLMYVASVMVILLVGVLLRHTMFRGLEPEPLMLALPAYQCPRALQLARSVLLRLWGFIRGASVIIISMITALWLLQGIPVTANAGGFAHVDDVHDSAYGVLADAVAPVFARPVSMTGMPRRADHGIRGQRGRGRFDVAVIPCGRTG